MKIPNQAQPVQSTGKTVNASVQQSGIACTLCKAACSALAPTPQALCIAACNATVCS